MYMTENKTISFLCLKHSPRGKARVKSRTLSSEIEVLRMGIFSGYFRLAAAMFEGSNVQWRLGEIAFHIADKLRRQLTRQG